MTDSASELESDASSIDGSSAIRNLATGIDSETLQRRLERLLRENGTLHSELEGAKIKIRSLTSENRDLRAASVTIQQKAEQEEEFISNTLLKKIQSLKKEKESLAINFEQEEESITNELQRKLNQLRSEKIELESAREREQECQVSKLMRRIEKLESDVGFKQRTLEQMRHEKIELENTLEQEQEALVNRLWKKMEHSEAEKRMLGARLDAIPIALQIYAQHPQQAVAAEDAAAMETASSEPADDNQSPNSEELERTVVELKRELFRTHAHLADRVSHLEHVEHLLVDENVRLRRRVHQLELERSRASLTRNRSESESSLDASEQPLHWQHPASAAGDRVHLGSCPSPMNVDRPGSAGPVPVRGGPALAVQTGLPPPGPLPSASRQSPSGSQHESLQLQLLAGLAAQHSPGSSRQQDSGLLPKVCRECGSVLVVYSSSLTGLVCGTQNAGAFQTGSTRASLSSLSALLPSSSAAANVGPFRD